MVRNLGLLVLLLSAMSGLQAQEVVKWVDENGVTHFGNAPPPGNIKAETVKIAPANSLAVPNSQSSVKAPPRSASSNSPGGRIVTLQGKKPPTKRATPRKRSKKANKCW